jgi:hypothetical protein
MRKVGFGQSGCNSHPDYENEAYDESTGKMDPPRPARDAAAAGQQPSATEPRAICNEFCADSGKQGDVGLWVQLGCDNTS